MDITLPDYLLASLLADAAEAGAARAYELAGLSKVGISKEAAYRIYGRAKVDRWITDGRIKKDKSGKWDIDRTTLECLHKIDQKPAYKSIKQHR